MQAPRDRIIQLVAAPPGYTYAERRLTGDKAAWITSHHPVMCLALVESDARFEAGEDFPESRSVRAVALDDSWDSIGHDFEEIVVSSGESCGGYCVDGHLEARITDAAHATTPTR